MVVKPSEWKFMAIIARNAKFLGHYTNFCPIWVKNGKKLIIFNNSLWLVSLKVTKLIIIYCFVN